MVRDPRDYSLVLLTGTKGATAGFRTDNDISRGRSGQERELQPWIAPADGSIDQSLESTTSQGTWDQFQANENLFGVKSDYDENYYTSRIDKSHPEYRQRAAEAARIASRMGETQKGEVNEGEGLDEEDKYVGPFPYSESISLIPKSGIAAFGEMRLTILRCNLPQIVISRPHVDHPPIKLPFKEFLWTQPSYRHRLPDLVRRTNFRRRRRGRRKTSRMHKQLATCLNLAESPMPPTSPKN